MSLSFPPSPTLGQIYQSWIWNGQAWSPSAVSLAPLGTQVFVASGTWTPRPGMVTAIIEAVGGGAGGAGNSGGSGAFQYGYGGGSGGYSRKFVTAAQVGASLPVTIGAGGAGGAYNGAPGAGGDTSVGTLCVARGAPSGGASSTAAAGPPGAPTGTGDVVAAGAPGQGGSNAVGVWTPAGGGGSSHFGGGAQPVSVPLADPGFTAGNNASSYGGGGGGATTRNSASGPPGGAGSPGVVVITEYGSSAPVLWTSPTRLPGDRVLISKQVVSTAVAAVVFTGINATYDQWVAEFSCVQSSVTDQAVMMQVSADGGSTWLGSGQYLGSWVNATSAGGGGFTGAAGQAGVVLGLQAGGGVGHGSNGNITWWKPTDATIYKNFLWNVAGITSSNVGWSSPGASFINSPFTAVRFLMNSGNVAAGSTFELYGIQK